MPTDTHSDPRTELEQLEQRILDGDTSVSAASLAKVKAAAELARMHDQAAELQRQREAADKHEAEVEALRLEIDKASRGLSDLQTAYADLVSSARNLAARLNAWQSIRSQLVPRAKVFDLTDELDALPALTRDFIKLAIDEASGHPMGGGTRSSGTGWHRDVRFHELHSKEARDLLLAEDEVEAEVAARRHAEREAERAREAQERNHDVITLTG